MTETYLSCSNDRANACQAFVSKVSGSNKVYFKKYVNIKKTQL